MREYVQYNYVIENLDTPRKNVDNDRDRSGPLLKEPQSDRDKSQAG
jgi:hypothetical protein